MKKLIATLLLIIINTTFAADLKKDPREFCDIKCDPTDLVTDESIKRSRNANEASLYQFMIEYYAYLDDCRKDNKHTEARVKEVSVQPTISSLQKELNACKSQLQIIQEKEPRVYDKLQREFKKIKESGHSPNYYKRDTVSKTVPK